METVRAADGTPIAYERSGGGPPVVVVNGALADRTATAPIATALGEWFTVVAYDRRGLGDSGDTSPYAVEREIEDLAAVIGAAGGSAHVFGHSSGGILALEATARGVGIDRLVAYEPPFVVDDSHEPVDVLLDEVRERLAIGDRSGALEAFFVRAVQMPAPLVAQMKTTPAWAGMERMAHTLPYNMVVTGDHGVPAERLAAIGVPTLVMLGGDSPPFMAAAVRDVAAAVPGARQQILPGQTHRADPRVLAPALRDFFLG
jgi:pimeloyl-ACP methyl ester carboxylesterase